MCKVLAMGLENHPWLEQLLSSLLCL